MRFGKIIICMFTVLLLLLAGIASTQELDVTGEVSLPLSFSVASEAATEEIVCWKDAQSDYYVFLPGYGMLEDVTANLPDGQQISLGGTPLSDGMSCGAFQTDVPYEILWEGSQDEAGARLTFVRSSQMPALYVDVRSGSMDYIHMDKNFEEPGVMRLYDEDGTLLVSETLDSVKGRGNSSWGAEKKPYNLMLSQERDLLGMGAAQRWVLLAEGLSSSVNIRNKMVYDYAALAGLKYSPDSRWVELYLNGEYAGLYLLCERNEVHSNRVNISGENSFLVSLEFEYRLQEASHPYILTDSGQTLRIHTSAMDDRELDALWQSVENAILKEDGVDPRTGRHWRELIDMESWARKYLLEEMFGNGDGGSLSQFFYRDGNDPEGKIYAGPVWDFDMAMGGYDIWLKPYTDYYVMNRDQKEAGYATPWFYGLYQNEEFYSCVTELFETEMYPLMERLLSENLDQYILQSYESQLTNAIRWNLSEKQVSGELEYIRNFLTNRLDFLTDVWIRETKYHVVRVNTGRAEMYGYLAVKPGDCLPELPSYEDIRGIGWFREDTGEPFDVTQPIYEDMQIYVKVPPFQIPKIHYAPAAGMLAVLLGLAVLNICRTKKNGRRRNDRAKANQISS